MDCDRGRRVDVRCRVLEFAGSIAPLDGAEMIKLWHGMADERGGGACVPLHAQWRREARLGASPAGGPSSSSSMAMVALPKLLATAG
jgi:hypothetical protein